ncbi:lipid-A-disaccharide synthase [Ferrimonas marina]|uniref:Lipid-A-disaccharide synthase n=1 Tax=Ferrimonas marina TaxID=299255 RepID=A0A1M5YF63_9GAMM|nr:lipid-A-disaccharide synthase [Ferrimonas marina]SHI10667.1 lipid-A-disaccharide synthase [Ferrimonas marina]
MEEFRPLTIAIVAGEISGDILGAGLLKALRQQHPDARFVGIGGELMIEQGLDSWFPMEELSVMGLVEVLGRLPRLLKIKRELVERITELKPDVFVGVDAPDFNLRVEKTLKDAGIPTVHYVSPSVWAWRPKRIFKIDAATDQVLALLPFEKAFYDQHQVSCEFVGHTLADEIPLVSEPGPAREALGLPAQGKVLAMLPGSRGGEMSRIGPVFLQAAAELQRRLPDLTIAVPLANAARREQLETLLAEMEQAPELTLVDGRSREVMTASDAILLASGTATLEAMLVKRPMVVAYKVSTLTYHIAKAMMSVDRVALPNLLSGEDLVPELLQYDCTVEKLVAEVEQKLTLDPTPLVSRFTELHQQIRRDASARAAEAVMAVVEANKQRRLHDNPVMESDDGEGGDGDGGD